LSPGSVSMSGTRSLNATIRSAPSVRVAARRYPGLIPLASGMWAQVAVGLLVCILAIWSLTAFPAPWYDEGINLHAAANLASGRGYGLLYGDAGGLRAFDMQLTTGPTVI